MDLTGKVVIVVGACGRLGREVVLSAWQSGATVLAADTDRDQLEEMKKQFIDRISVYVCDITSTASVQELLSFGVATYGRLDGAVNAAYPRNTSYGRHFFDVSIEDFCENVSLHLGGYFLFMQQCAKYAVDGGVKFSLVNISSVYGVISPRFDVYQGTEMTMPVEYAAIKSALQHISRYTTSYTKGSQFRVNCVSPGGIEAGQDPTFLQRYRQLSGSKGMLDSRDVVGAVRFLLSDASEYVCGQNIVVDDGFST
ncbi:oxidoreductase [Pollutimonas thiosulfatoxidans]|uniref:Flagellin modification protein A n=1 Tax=Pollutimonas thiosulfatoxidans TaxID=2028345 RepID=A0A410GEJ6_9BURK|nr:oxidoreductase [Pollutimonas thiosulfatoxidans]QAA94708.1 hypothetical protein CKA81_13300 [Pollutimonas thiosulfatoxidans]